jgi:MFS transporter, FHS family, L-fucose permease
MLAPKVFQSSNKAPYTKKLTVSLAGYFINYATEVRKGTTSAQGSNFLAIAQGCFAIGRFTGSGLMKVIKPRRAFLIYYIGVVASLAIAIGVRGSPGVGMLFSCSLLSSHFANYSSPAFLSLTLFFESICFPTIFALGIRGLGVHTKRGSSFIIASIIGGAIVPPLTAVTADAFNDTGRAFFVPFIFFLFSITFAFACNFHPRTKAIMDGFHNSKVGVVDAETGDLKVVIGNVDLGDSAEEKVVATHHEEKVG